MKSKDSKKIPFTPAQRQARHKRKLEKFGIKKIGFKASRSQRELIRLAGERANCSSREEFILEAITVYAESLGLSLAEINKDLLANESIEA
ncbi:hypothetical protein [Vibrio marisflavi]|uniref:Uncharacterized protein n=1 Tax=Vibrio marisflavi CECT 7928 TaxID=634439 RepID=A0ABM9A9P6_9VIBR|nr:hypothetical protein [Vibrio marisflavi]CAH0543154.1 hypothetical protein VMF7928_04427 [Vibrio marisflavi CECT 7928]